MRVRTQVLGSLTLLVAALVATGASAQIGGGGLASCPPANEVAWPSAADPTWEFCWITPNDSTGFNGAGLELVNVRYRGIPVIGRAGLPIVNVEYVDQTCGGFCTCGPCYRDWTNEQTPASSGDPNTAPDGMSYGICGRTVDCPGFGQPCSVTFEDLPDRLVATAVMSAGWYRYTQQWIFHESGRLEPRVTFSAVDDPCTYEPHVHHAYWRLDLDIAGPAEDTAREYKDGRHGVRGTNLRKEVIKTRDNAVNKYWRVAEGPAADATMFTEIFPELDDEPSDDWGGGDVWFVRSNLGEHQDGGAACREGIDGFVDRENLSGQDLVVWLGTHSGHDEACCTTTPECIDNGWHLQFSW